MNKVLQTRPSRLVYFDSLYTEVTNKIRGFTQSNTSLSTRDIVWINDLVKGFNDKYEDWEQVEAGYLAALHKREGNLFVLCGHAFLHIANDLPIVLADNIDKNLSAPEIAQLKQTYERLREPLTGSVQAKWKKPLLIRLMMFPPFRFEKIFIAWLVNLRGEAWDNAQKILYAGNKEQAILELRNCVGKAMLKAKSGSRITFWSRIFELTIYVGAIFLALIVPLELTWNQGGNLLTITEFKVDPKIIIYFVLGIFFLFSILPRMFRKKMLPTFEMKFESEKL